MIFELNLHLSFVDLVVDEWMAKKGVGVWTLVIVFYQRLINEALKPAMDGQHYLQIPVTLANI